MKTVKTRQVDGKIKQKFVNLKMKLKKNGKRRKIDGKSDVLVFTKN